MDFDFHYTKQQEEFRKEVRAFIEANALKEPRKTADPGKVTLDEFRKGRELEKKLGERGWYAPNYPKAYGGGGLDTEHCMVLVEEFDKIMDEHRWIGSTQVNAIEVTGLLAFGSEEQKRKLLTPMLRAEWQGAQCFTEPDAGTDEASQKSTAIRRGDVFIVNGDKVFVGRSPVGIPIDYLYWTAITDPKAPRHQNLGAFLIPGNLPGINYIPLNLMGAESPQKWEIICEDVNCPADRLIGGETQGWQVAQASLAVEHGGAGSLRSVGGGLTKRFIEYCKKTLRNGQPISRDPAIQDILVKLYTESQISRLWGLRNYAMAEGQIPRVFYTGTQTMLHNKRHSPEQAKAFMDVLGPYSLIDDPELQVLLGAIERSVRMGDITHIGGTPETQQIMMSRALGLGRAVARGTK